MMIRSIVLASLLLVPIAGVHAQDSSGAAATTSGPGARGGNITSTGQTTPNPGGSKSQGTTSLDRGVQEKDNQIQGSVCKGC